MALADDIMTRYRSGGGGDAEPDGDEGGDKTPAQIEAARAAFAAIKKGDASAFCEAVKKIASEY